MELKDYNLKSSTSYSKLPDYGAAEISRDTYKRNRKNIRISKGDFKVTYRVVEPIEDPKTGLHGYVLQN